MYHVHEFRDSTTVLDTENTLQKLERASQGSDGGTELLEFKKYLGNALRHRV